MRTGGLTRVAALLSSTWRRALVHDDKRVSPRGEVASIRAKISTYEDVLLNWVISEAIGESWQHAYRPLVGNALWERLKAYGLDVLPSLGASERLTLLGALFDHRRPILADYPLHSYVRFRRRRAALREIERFMVIPFFAQFGITSVTELSERLHADQMPTLAGMRADVLAIIEARRHGRAAHGTPIAALPRGAMGPVLVEGYKRSIAAMWMSERFVQLYICEE